MLVSGGGTLATRILEFDKKLNATINDFIATKLAHRLDVMVGNIGVWRDMGTLGNTQSAVRIMQLQNLIVA